MGLNFCNCLEIAEGQAESIVQDIENMVRAFIEKVMILYKTKWFLMHMRTFICYEVKNVKGNN